MPAGKGGAQPHNFRLTTYSKAIFCGVCSKFLVRLLLNNLEHTSYRIGCSGGFQDRATSALVLK